MLQPITLNRLLLVAALISLLAPTPTQAHTGRVVKGFENPDSAIWFGKTGSFYVSNIGPSQVESLPRRYDGYLSEVSGEGRLVTAKWVTGLRSPKGMHRRGDELLVVDAGQLVMIDVAGARVRQSTDLENSLHSGFLSDVAVDPRTGDAFVSDTTLNRIYRLPARGKPEVWMESAELNGPNGLFLDDYRLLVASYGEDPDGDGPAPPKPGRILVIDMHTKQLTPLGGMALLGNLDGIERLGSDWIVTDGAGRVWRVTEEGKATELAQIANAADLGVRTGDRVAAIPTLADNTVVFLTVP